MERCRRVRNHRNLSSKASQLPKLSLALSSVRLIVDKFEECAPENTYECNQRELIKYDPHKRVDEKSSYYSPLDTSRGRVWKLIHTLIIGQAFSRCIPRVSYGNFGVLAVVISAIGPRMLSYLVLYPLCRLVFGTLYPAYASYKAVRTKNLKEYVKWMMYWIVFALFTCTETFTDMFLSWFPFYYEVKIVLVLWLLSPATKGSSILYRKFVHPALCRREQEIDEYIAKAKDQGYHTVLNLGTKGVNYATTVIMQTAIKNFNLPNHLEQAENEARANRRGIVSQDRPDGRFEEYEFERNYDDNAPGVIGIVEIDDDDMNRELDYGDNYDVDPDFDPTSYSAARSRGNVIRKRKVAKDKEKRPRSRSRGRRTRSQTAQEKEVRVD